MTSRTRIALLAGIVVLAVVGAAGYVWLAQRNRADALAQAPDRAVDADLAAVARGPHLVFRNTAVGAGYGQVAVVPLDRPGGARALTPATCERVFAIRGEALCVAADRGLVTTYSAQLLDASWAPTRTLPLVGLPSRARLSADGTLAATTTFVHGDSYADPGQFSTRTVVSHADGAPGQDLEQFRLLVDGAQVRAADRNLWGVTFVDDDTFYATAASGGRTWLVRGQLSQRTLTSVRSDVECPSLSPDRTRIAFKKHGDLPAGQWRLAVYDLATGRETVLAETRSVDDQVVWLDNRQIIYGLPRAGEGSASSDVWVVPADGSGTPGLLIPDAWSPSVVR
ncbi:MAG TPA: hypothetical protein VF163_01155 [Micromonosporaceae bacterium]